LLSNVGLPGLILTGWLLSQLYSQVRKHLASAYYDSTIRTFLYALSAAFAANIFALLLSGAEISQPHLWILWGLLLGTIRHDWLRERQLDGDAIAISVPLANANLRA
jgi:ABC-type Fe3+ transport system permease subunit